MAKEITTKAANRFEWAASLIQPEPDDQILEIGCGAGLLAELIAALLSAGMLMAIDSSASMIRKSEKRNQAAISNGKLILLTKSFIEIRVSSTVQQGRRLQRECLSGRTPMMN